MTNSETMPLRFSPCTLELYAQVLDFLDLCFKKEKKHWFAENLPHIFDNTPDKVKRHICAWKDNRLAGVIGVYPLTLKIGGAYLSVGGIGSVSVHPSFRNQGIMSRMLQHAQGILKEEGYTLSWLRGDRFRYRNYGWECGSARRLYTIACRDLCRYFPNSSPVGYKDVSADSIDALINIYKLFKSSVNRSREQWLHHIQRSWAQWVHGESPDGEAYLAFERANPQRIIEIQGNVATVVSLLISHMKNAGIDYVTVPYPDYDDALSVRLNHCFCDMRVEPAGMIRVVDAKRAWEALVPEMQQLGASKHSKNFAISASELSEKQKEAVLSRLLAFPYLHAGDNHYNLLNNSRLSWWISELDYV